MSYAGGRSTGGGAGLDEEDVPAEDSELTWQGSQSTIMAELALHRELAAAASLCAAASAGSKSSGVTGGDAARAHPHSYDMPDASRGELLVARQQSYGSAAQLARSFPRPHSASVIQARRDADSTSFGVSPRVCLTRPAPPHDRSTTARWPAS